MSAKEQAAKFVAECQRRGFTWEVVSPSVIRVRKSFAPYDRDAYTDCDHFGPQLLSLAPLKGGSVWGSDGGSVGGHVALSNGDYVLSKSGEGVRFTNALAKIKGKS